MRTFVVTMCAAAAFGGLSAAADEPLRAQKPAVDRDYQWSVTFEKNVAVIRAEADAPEGIVATTIEALKNAGHKKFAIKQFVTPEEAPRRDTSWIQIRVRNQEAEIALTRDLPYKTVVEVIEHLQKCDVKTIRFAPPQKSK